MKKSVRHLAIYILNQVHRSHLFAGDLLDKCLNLNSLSGTPDGRLLTHLVYGVLRLRGHLDWILKKLYRGDFEKMDEDIKNVLRLGIYQLKFSDRLPDFAVVNEAVKIAKVLKPDKSDLVNAILRNYLRHGENLSFPSPEKNPAEYLAAFHSHPLWLVKKWINLSGVEETIALCSANNEQPPLTARVNTLKISRKDLMQRLTAAGFEPQATEYSPDGIILNASTSPVQKTDFFKSGLLRLQDEASQLISYLIKSNSNESILDACTGSGGKATHLAAILKNKGKIVAIDRNPGKITELKAESTRLGINIIEMKKGDMEICPYDSLKEKFDYVLVDAPCSGTGTLRRNPEIKWRIEEKDLLKFAAVQKIILKNASLAVKKGGLLIYCTCSLLPEENENIVDDYLKHYPEFSLCRPTEPINRQLIDSRGFFRTSPQRHKMDGFFGAILKYQ